MCNGYKVSKTWRARPYMNLNPEAKLNVNADKLATLFHNIPNATKHMPATPHKPPPARSQSQSWRQGMQASLMSTSVTTSIADICADIFKTPATGQTWCGTQLICTHLAITPSMYKKHCINMNKFKHSAVADVSLKLCPCCQIHERSIHTYSNVPQNPARAEAKNVRMKSDTMQFTFMLTSHWLLLSSMHEPAQQPTFHNDKFLAH